jgi:uncharacterized protein YcbK (DUF882 family)
VGNLSEHYNHQDFFCKCEACKANKEYKIHLGLVGALEMLHILINKPVKVKTAFRCAAENERLGGGRKSFHLYGKAAHIFVDGMKPQELFMKAQEVPEIRGLGLNVDDGTVHVDLREVPAREEWVKERGKYVVLTPEKKPQYGLQ